MSTTKTTVRKPTTKAKLKNATESVGAEVSLSPFAHVLTEAQLAAVKHATALTQHPVISAPSLVETDGTLLCGKWTVEIRDIGLDAEGQPVLVNKVESIIDGEIWRRCSWAFSELTGFGIAQNAHGAFKILSVDHKSRLVTVERRDGYEVSPIGRAFMDRIRGRGLLQLVVTQVHSVPADWDYRQRRW